MVGFVLAVHWGDGHWDRVGFQFLTTGLLCAATAAIAMGRRPAPLGPALGGSALAILTVWTALLAPQPFGYYLWSPTEVANGLRGRTVLLRPPWIAAFGGEAWRFLGLVALYAGSVGTAIGLIRDSVRTAIVRRSAFIAAFVLLAAWLVVRSPQPFVDVWYVTQAGCARLLALKNPYTLSIPDIYNEGRTLDHFPYPPPVVLFETPYYAMTGDVRVGQAVAILAFGVAVVALGLRSGLAPATADALGAVAVFHPRILYVLEQAWIEPLSAALIGWGFVAYTSRRYALAVPLFGLALASKQYLVILLPILLLLPGSRREAGRRHRGRRRSGNRAVPTLAYSGIPPLSGSGW